jgi:hypothetical protein
MERRGAENKLPLCGRATALVAPFTLSLSFCVKYHGSGKGDTTCGLSNF